MNTNLVSLARPHPRNKLVIGSLTGIFASIIVQLAVQWYFTSSCFVGACKNRLALFLFTTESILTPVVGLLIVVTQVIGRILADGLLVKLLLLKPQSGKIDWLKTALVLLVDSISAKIHKTGIDMSLHYRTRQVT